MKLSGIASVHSHAFQRALRGRTQRQSEDGSNSTERSAEGSEANFWNWRELMFKLANELEPDDMYSISRYAFAELARHGVTLVGEFHYLHHQRGGVPYADRLAMSHAVIQAALDVGIRIAFLRTIYERNSARESAQGAQLRFVDREPDDAFSDALDLRDFYADEPLVSIGLAAHSVRTVRSTTLEAVARFADKEQMIVHAHVAEQPREVDECISEHGVTPAALLRDLGVIRPTFTAVHATHLNDQDVEILSKGFVAICRTTERDLGDGFPRSKDLHLAGARFVIGTDSHTCSDPFQEAAAIENDERARSGKRLVLFEAPALQEILTMHGYASLGVETNNDQVSVDTNHVTLAGSSSATALDCLFFGGSGLAVQSLNVAGKSVDPQAALDEARPGFESALRNQGLL